MKTNVATGLLTLTLLLGLGPQGVIAADMPKSPTTLWNFLGFPQATHRLRDATANRFGKNPEKERTEPLKRIADPANLESDNPAIKAAAQVKAEADLEPQKIKAIRYLAEIGCACSSRSDDIQKALLAALDDCSEEVRYEAAMAMCKTAGSVCQSCDATCCGTDAITKLRDVAVGKDDKDCWNESSSRVRAVALSALNTCEMKHEPKKPEEKKKPEIREQRDEPEVQTRDIKKPSPIEPGTERLMIVPEPPVAPSKRSSRVSPAGEAWISSGPRSPRH